MFTLSLCIWNFAGQATSSQTHTQPVPVGGLPVDLQNIRVNLFSATGGSSLSSMTTHTISTTPTTVPNISSTISINTPVTPTSSSTEPLLVAGVGLGVGAPNSTEEEAPPAETDAFPVPSSNPEVGRRLSQNLTASGGITSKAPAVANIFYPISTASSLEMEKAMETPENNTAAPVQMGNFLNVTTSCTDMCLNDFSVVVGDGKRDSSGLKVGGFSTHAAVSSENVFSDLAKQNQNAGRIDASEMDVGESEAGMSGDIKPMDTTDKPVANLTPRHSSRKTSMEDEPEQKGDANSMLRRILTMKDEDVNTPGSKAGSPTPESSPVETPTDFFADGNTQATLIEKSEQLRLGSDAQQDNDMQPDFWTSTPSFANDSVEEAIPSKVQRGIDDLDASSKQVSLPSVEKLFDAGGATSSSAFVFTKFGTDVPGILTFGNSTSDTISSVSTNVTEAR